MAEGGTLDGDVATFGDDVQFLTTPEGRKLAYHQLSGARPGVVFVHGIRSNMWGQKSLALEAFCRSKGRAYTRFELSGHGQSSEKFEACNFTMWLEDLHAVLSLCEGPQIVVGSSIGGWLMFLYTMRHPERVYSLIGVSAAPDFTQQLWKDLDKKTQHEVRMSGVYNLNSPFSSQPCPITLQLVQDGDKHSVLDMPGIEYIKVPVWLFHGEQDTVVPASTALKLMQKLQCPVSLKTVPDGDHRLSRPEDIRLIENALEEVMNAEMATSTSLDDDPED